MTQVIKQNWDLARTWELTKLLAKLLKNVMGIFNDTQKNYNTVSLLFLDSWGKINWVQAEETWSSD